MCNDSTLIFAYGKKAPLKVQTANKENVARTFKVSNEDAKRGAFVNKSCGKNIADASHYDMIVNTGKLRIESAVETICLLWCC